MVCYSERRAWTASTRRRARAGRAEATTAATKRIAAEAIREGAPGNWSSETYLPITRAKTMPTRTPEPTPMEAITKPSLRTSARRLTG